MWCLEVIAPDDDLVSIISRKRNKRVKEKWMANAYKTKVLLQFHNKCYAWWRD